MKEDLKRAMNIEEYCDIIFVVEGIPIYLHKLIILSRFPSFLEGIKEERCIPINNVSYEVFNCIAEWIYTGSFSLPSSKVKLEELRRVVREWSLLAMLLLIPDELPAKQDEKSMIVDEKAINFKLIFNEESMSIILDNQDN
jgi:hypothetical protein